MNRWEDFAFNEIHTLIRALNITQNSPLNVNAPELRYLAALFGLAPIFPDTFYRLTHYWFAAADIPVANDIPVHCADAIRCNVRRPPQGSLPLLTRQVLA